MIGRSLLLGLLGTALSTLATGAYRRVAMRHGVVALPNQRSLHVEATPSGGGAAFALVFLVLAAGQLAFAASDRQFGRLILVGGLVALVAGVADDRWVLPQRLKLATYASLAGWILYATGGAALVDIPGVPHGVSQALSWLVFVWIMNLYNFVDGIDGMAASGAVYICVALVVALVSGGGGAPIVPVVVALAGCVLGFLAFNWPPARLFMGDAGSLFLGFQFAALVAWTRVTSEMSAWTWIVIFGYLGADTTTTTLLRMVLVRRFWEGHRSHAYQNLARVWQSHRRVVRGVLLYQVCWLLPLTVASVRWPSAGWWIAVLAAGPAVGWTWRFGPRFSRT